MKRALALVCVLLAGVIALEWRQPVAVPMLAGPAQPPRPQAPPRFEFGDASRFGVVVERSLFHPSRRGPAGPAAAPHAPQRSAWDDSLVLTGVLLMPKRKLALLQQPGSAQILPLQPGARVHGWLLVDVREDRVLLQRDGAVHELLLQQ